MINRLLELLNNPSPAEGSQLFSEETFYKAFLKDLGRCTNEVIIESPFVTRKRVTQLLPVLQKLKSCRVKIVINTRDPAEHENYLRDEAIGGIAALQHIGVQVIYTETHHRKLAVLDRTVLWEGSLNILSQNKSQEVMRRTESTKLAWQMVRFTRLDLRMN